MTITAGIDVGTGAVKTTLFKVEGDNVEWLSKRISRIRRRDPMALSTKTMMPCWQKPVSQLTMSTMWQQQGMVKMCRSAQATSIP